MKNLMPKRLAKIRSFGAILEKRNWPTASRCPRINWRVCDQTTPPILGIGNGLNCLHMINNSGSGYFLIGNSKLFISFDRNRSAFRCEILGGRIFGCHFGFRAKYVTSHVGVKELSNFAAAR